MSNASRKDKRESIIKVVETQEFDGLLKSKITTTFDLAKTINGLFRPIFSDYEGCLIYPDQWGVLQLTLFFKDKGEAGPNQIKNLESVIQKADKNDAMARIRNINNLNSSQKYDLSELTKDALEEFMIGYNPNAKFNWKSSVVELTERQPYNAYSVYVRVNGLDIMKVIKKIYGNKLENGNYIDYQVNIIKPTASNNMGGMNSNFLINISQLDTKLVEKLCMEVGMVPTTGAIQFIRE